MILAPLAHRIVLVAGWRRRLLAAAAGALGALAMPPTGTYAWPAVALAFPALVWLLDGAGGGAAGLRAAAAIGWWFGFGYFLAGLWWIGAAFLVDAPRFGWMLPFAVIALPAGLALFTAAGTALARAAWSPGPGRVFALAAGLGLAEWLRGHVLTGFPWNTFGYALTADPRLAQGAALGGVWSLTLAAVALGALPALLADAPRDTPRPWRWLAGGGALLAALFAYGAVRLATVEVGRTEGVQLRVMQPNLPQDQKFNYGARDAVMARYVRLSDLSQRAAGAPEPTHLIWPESAFPFFLAREAGALATIADLLPRGTWLVTGAARLDERADKPARERDIYNAVQVLDADGAIVATYDKVHLVPFGEFLPFQGALEAIGIEQLTRVRGGFARGAPRRALAVPGAPPAAPLICYEAVFPSAVVPAGPRPHWMLNVTNDGWFGHTSGPYQHFEQARVRAIEEGLPVVRAANTGISAVVDPLGRVLARLPVGAEGHIDSALPMPVPPPVYAIFGDFVPLLLWFFAVLVAFGYRRVARGGSRTLNASTGNSATMSHGVQARANDR